MAFSEDFLMELKRRNDIYSVVSSYLSLKGSGRTLKGLCPFHGEKTPSFTIYTDSDSFYCFGCHVGGDVVRFIMLIENLPYAEAVKFLADRAGMEVPADTAQSGTAQLRNTVLAINLETAKYYNNLLFSPQGAEGMKYLTDRFLATSTIRHFGLGFSPNEWNALTGHLKGLGFKESDMLAANVAVKGKNGGIYDRFRHRVIFPVIDVRGNVIAFSARQLPGDSFGGKYVNTSDTIVYNKGKNLFAINFAKNFCKENLILCEGQMDVIALHQAGIQNAVAPLGTAFTDDQAHMMAKYTEEIVIAMDPDGAGKSATEKAINILKKHGLRTKVIHIPGGKDPDEFIRHYGKEGGQRFKALIGGAKNDIEYRLITARENYDLTLADGVIQYINNEATDILAGTDSVTAEVYASKLSEEFSISKREIINLISIKRSRYIKTVKKQEIQNAMQTVRRDEVNPDRNNRKFVKAANAEEAILSLLLKNPDFFKKDDRLKEELFITDFNKRLFSVLSSRNAEGKDNDLTLIYNQFTDAENDRIAAILASGESRANTASELKSCIDILESEAIKLSDVGGMTDEQLKEKIEQMRKAQKNKKGD